MWVAAARNLPLKCLAAPAHWPDALVWGIVAGTVEQPHVVPVQPQPITPELIEAAAPATPREVFRIASICIKRACRHWREGAAATEGDGRCSLVERVVSGYPEIGLQPCGIRATCRWFAQEGARACRACPGICTDIGELPQDAESEATVPFF